jgi:hypothetical protein
MAMSFALEAAVMGYHNKAATDSISESVVRLLNNNDEIRIIQAAEDNGHEECLDDRLRYVLSLVKAYRYSQEMHDFYSSFVELVKSKLLTFGGGLAQGIMQWPGLTWTS